MLLADRFLRRHDTWFDISSAEPVLLSVQPAGTLRQQIAWVETCAMLSRLRHPLLNPLVDYGVADTASLFEAYAPRPPLSVSPIAATRLVMHGSRFLEAHGVPVAASAARLVFRRTVVSTRGQRPRPVGVVLQPRRAVHVLADVFATNLRGGSTAITLSGAYGAGLRTAITFISQMARMEGYVPVCAAAIARWPVLLDLLAGRHVCLLLQSGASTAERSAAATLLTRLATASARPHIVLNINRAERPAAGALHLESMGTTCMASMVYADPEYGPSPGEMFEAARRADGCPGHFLAGLGARAVDSLGGGAYTVHESPAVYGAGTVSTPTSAATRRSRISSVLYRASSRASALETRGRHAAAVRLLVRAARALEGRGDAAEAAHCWRHLGWTARSRGATTLALQHAHAAARADRSAEGQAGAAILTAVCYTDEGRLIEAEATLRSLVTAAAVAQHARLKASSLLALARVLYWDGRGSEALPLIAPLEDAVDAETACETLLARSKAMLQILDVPGSLQAARCAFSRATSTGHPRLRAAVHRVTADALRAAGDLEGMRQQVHAGLEAAAAAHLPLAALRLRAMLLRGLQDMDPATPDATRLRTYLERALRRPLPALLRRVLEEVCARRTAAPSAARLSSVAGRGDVEHFLEIAHRARDDSTAVTDVLTALCDRTAAASTAVLVGPGGRILACAGKPWRDEPGTGVRALESGLPIPPDGSLPAELGEPVRCGGELVGAIACRWLPGTCPQPSAAAITRAAGMAMAAEIRALIESRLPHPPPLAWGDLLGDSAAAHALREAIVRAARAPFPVLVEGESGSGKELVARAIHKLSPRHPRRFCAINCAALTDELVEAELFGHTRGAFTGAATDRAGLFEEADGGTLFLDEVGELSARAQAKLLRVIQEGEVRRVGENLPRRVDVRVISATNRRLSEEAEGGRFRTDLRFRLDVLRIVVPPLRERVADIPVLAQHFWRQACARVGGQATLGPDALAALARHDWPGNVRELQNVIAWMAVHAPRRGRVSAALLPAQLASSPLATGSFEAAREEFERRYVRAALAQAGGHRQVAAKALGISRQGLAKMLRRLGLEPDARA